MTTQRWKLKQHMEWCWYGKSPVNFSLFISTHSCRFWTAVLTSCGYLQEQFVTQQWILFLFSDGCQPFAVVGGGPLYRRERGTGVSWLLQFITVHGMCIGKEPSHVRKASVGSQYSAPASLTFYGDHHFYITTTGRESPGEHFLPVLCFSRNHHANIE